ncbi:unnamed protein product [Rodentolepis nana]|uniref:Uncharacterized protein n=1 Tax=Rodentolepis nana TaxID=102285 RepID=A0A0R3TE67_RODNA|nr:unnamed protein product [Rodentolepis nana]
MTVGFLLIHWLIQAIFDPQLSGFSSKLTSFSDFKSNAVLPIHRILFE